MNKTRWQKIKNVFVMSRRHRSIQRILLRWRCQTLGAEHKFYAPVVDLGSGQNNEYYEYLQISPSDVTRVDVSGEKKPDVVTDLNLALPFASRSYQTALCINAIYILRNPAHLLTEIDRILMPGGHAIIWFPSIFNEAPEPVDYWRFTSGGVKLLISESGLALTELIKVGERCSARFYLAEPLWRFWPLFFLGRLAALLGDRLLPKKLACHQPAPIGYLALIRKS